MKKSRSGVGRLFFDLLLLLVGGCFDFSHVHELVGVPFRFELHQLNSIFPVIKFPATIMRVGIVCSPLFYYVFLTHSSSLSGGMAAIFR